MEPLFEPGNNIAMKIPTHEYERTVDFYRTTIGLKEITPAQVGATPRFEFGDKTLWLDAAPGLS